MIIVKLRRKAKVAPEPPSMVNPSTDLLIRRTRSRYVLVMLASKRARQLLKGADCKVPNHDNKFVTNAFEEIAQKKIRARLTIENEQQAIENIPQKQQSEEAAESTVAAPMQIESFNLEDYADDEDLYPRE